MHANVHSDRGGGGGGGSWRLPPDETLQVQDPKEKLDVSKILIHFPFPHHSDVKIRFFEQKKQDL